MSSKVKNCYNLRFTEVKITLIEFNSLNFLFDSITLYKLLNHLKLQFNKVKMVMFGGKILRFEEFCQFFFFNLTSLIKRLKSSFKDLSLKSNTIQPQKTKEFMESGRKVKDYFKFTPPIFNALIVKDLLI